MDEEGRRADGEADESPMSLTRWLDASLLMGEATNRESAAMSAAVETVGRLDRNRLSCGCCGLVAPTVSLPVLLEEEATEGERGESEAS